jgi:hypothetical protein
LEKLMSRRILWSVVILLSASALVGALLTDAQGPVRAFLAFGFLLVCPGMALVSYLGIKQWSVELTLAIALSLALNTLLSEVMVLSGLWSPFWGTLIIVGVSSIAAFGQLIRHLYDEHHALVSR